MAKPGGKRAKQPKQQGTAAANGKKGKSKAAAAPKAAAKKAAEEEEDDGAWMGGVSDEEDVDLLGSDASDVGDLEDEEEEDDDVTGGEEGGSGGEAGTDDERGPTAQSKILARVDAGEQASDIGQIKQRIQDNAQRLSDWRKAKKMGETRQREEVLQSLVADCSTYYGYSEELAAYFLQMFSPEKAVEFFEANEKSRPLTIRTNSLKARRATLITALTARKVQLDPIGPWTKVGLKIYESAVPVGATPEYLGGQYMIQSASSLVPVMALAPQQDETVLDMAAAPGGKTTHIGQLMKNTGTIYANDLRKERCKSLVANVHRMGLTNVVVTCLDGRKLIKMLPKLDRVLLDAPCSGSGIIARDPGVKTKRGYKDFEEISTLQKELLTTAIDMVDAKSKTGGYIVYSTCSVSIEENEKVIDHVLKTRNVELVSFSSSVNFGVEGHTKYREQRFHPTMNLTRRFYPHVHNMDGFFVAKLKKTSNDIPTRTKKDRSKNGDIKVVGEEAWTPEMMETVVDFKETGEKKDANTEKAAVSASGKPLNKRERKKIKRAKMFAARAASTTGVGAAAAAAVGVSGVTPEEAAKAVATSAQRAAESSTPGKKPEAAKEEPKAAGKKKGLKRKAGDKGEPEKKAEKAEPAAAKSEEASGGKAEKAEPAAAKSEEASGGKAPLKKKRKKAA